MDNRKRSLNSIAKDYFQYLGRHLPQQCASDEFYFLPRSETAIQYLDILDDMAQDKIRDHVQYAQNLLGEISSEESDDLEREIDRLFVKQSMEGFIREFDDAKVWQSDPTLYVKIPLFATGRVLSQRDAAQESVKADLLTIFAQIPSFLGLATKNLRSPSEISLGCALDMVQDAIHFHHHDIQAFIEEKMGEDKDLYAKNREVLKSWEQYKKSLLQLSSKKSFAIGKDCLEEILSVSLSYPRSLDEILETARYSYQKTQEKLRALARKIDSRKTWDMIIYEHAPSISSFAELMQLYKEQVQDLRGFFSKRKILSFPSGEKIHVVQTPSYLQSLRATASYSAPLTGNTRSHGIFYFNPSEGDLALIASHCPYISAHETYPGHHILDHIRIHHPNSIRRQIESPLFYEGWACYAEHLLDEMGYLHDPHQQLIGLKRQLWRNLRAALDVELQTGRVTLDQGAKQIEALGFSSRRAQRQIRRFCLTPGYQLCYAMGLHEVLGLRRQFSSQMKLKTFHDILLEGGQLPFHLAERRLAASGAKYLTG